MIGPSKSKHKFISLFLKLKTSLSFPLSTYFVGSDLLGKPDKSYNCKSVFVLFLISLCFLHLLFNHVPAYAENKSVTNTLISKIHTKLKQYPNLICGVCVKPSWVKDSININGDYAFPAASLIKIPVAVALLQKIDKGQISWDKVLTLKHYHYAQGAGYLRTRKVGTKIRLREAFRLMLTISDNTATNMIIDLLGGVSGANQQILKLGLKNTRLVNWLGDFKGTNKTSPCDLAILLEKSLEGNLLSKNSKRILKSTLLDVKNTSLIKKGLGKYTRFAHKTGTIGICVGDAGIIYFPFGKRIAISILVKRPFNNLNGQKIIREISRIVYENLG